MLYEALLLETKGRSAFTDVLLFNYDNSPGQDDAPALIPGLLAKIKDAWDPQKPALVEPVGQVGGFDLPDLPDPNLGSPEPADPAEAGAIPN